MRRRRILTLVAAAMLACSSEQAPPDRTSAGGTSATSSTSTAGTTSVTTTSGGGGAGGKEGGCPGWPGWEAWDDYAPEEPFCVPATKDALPAPIAWEPCHPKAEMPVGCRQMSTPWKWKNSPIAYRASGDVASDGRVLLEFSRVALEEDAPYKMRIVAEADGPVRAAFLDPRGEGEQAFIFVTAEHGGGVGEGKTAFRVLSGANQDNFPEAIIGGDVDELHPKVLHSWESSLGHKVQASSMLLAAYAPWKVELGAWGAPLMTISNGGPEQFDLSLHEDKAVWVAGSHANGADVLAYDPSSGLVTLIPKPAPYNGVFGPGTDGVHLVWVKKTGKAQPSDPYTTADIMASPFATDPAALQPKRLRSYPTLPYVENKATVGCGYAAYTYATANDAGNVLIVRIADGYWWELPSSNCDPPDFSNDFCFGRVLAITCGEIFVGGGHGIAANIHRVELSALGDPNPPD